MSPLRGDRIEFSQPSFGARQKHKKHPQLRTKGTATNILTLSKPLDSMLVCVCEMQNANRNDPILSDQSQGHDQRSWFCRREWDDIGEAVNL